MKLTTIFFTCMAALSVFETHAQNVPPAVKGAITPTQSPSTIAKAQAAVATVSDAPTAKDGGYNGAGSWAQADELRAQNMLLELRVKNAELMKKLRDLDGAGAIASPTTPVNLPSIAALPASGPKQAQVLEISSYNHVSTARISLPSGSLANNVRVGSKLEGLGTVHDISISEVVIETKKGNLISLPAPTDVEPVKAASPIPGMPGMQGMSIPTNGVR